MLRAAAAPGRDARPGRDRRPQLLLVRPAVSAGPHARRRTSRRRSGAEGVPATVGDAAQLRHRHQLPPVYARSISTAGTSSTRCCKSQRFDWSRGQVSSYGLKECAQTYGIAPPDRVYLDRKEIVETYRTDPERVKTYAAQDAEETSALAALVAPTEFYQTQMIPDSYQNVAVTGNGEKINAILVREYLRQGRAIARQKPPQPYPGGYTEVRVTGVIKPIVKADVESLYPEPDADPEDRARPRTRWASSCRCCPS